MCTQGSDSECTANDIMRERNYEHCLPGYLTRILPHDHLDGDDVDITMTPRTYNWFIFCSICSILMHIIDMVFDYNIAIQYLLYNKITYFTWTICFIVIPSLINCIVSKRMQNQDKEIHTSTNDLNGTKISHIMIKNKYCFVVTVIFQLAPVLHYYESMKYALKAYQYGKSGDRVNASRNHSKMLTEVEDVALLRVFECFLEAAPQQILQLTILLKSHNEINFYFVHQVATIVSSLGSMGWAMATYNRSIRLAQQDKSNISNVGVAVQFFWHFFITVARILSVSVVASIWPIFTIICCIIHWICMTIWVVIDSHGMLQFCRDYSRSPHLKPKLREYVYSILFATVIGIIHIFIYFNTVDSNTFWKHLFFYILCFLENIACNVVWGYTSPAEVTCAWYFKVCLAFCTLSFFLGIAAMIIYYTIFHPSKKQHSAVSQIT
ncbi:PREDICTED: XK-related protein 6-like [Dinoponera quadriceps]|uniref:XK-related protein n=1 Tax=Dinoponera quadriceps TaxID=609295 RepID=A0A6P3WWH3_DINQU|nr:PREDICTED: XK-related protein 6-like [Dinoponera quadriceps]XP_014470453.1 PREDICTED: XK-related protein 6-like [Dinoponera quadriceps]XP_014470454.1 PREDICTED: XK-related protein 6-like [Dinoponera quadriceps]